MCYLGERLPRSCRVYYDITNGDQEQRMTKPTTLKDIARATGVHLSTVSRALDKDGRNSLTPEVVERVRKAAKEMGYRPNRMASSLRTRKTMTIGLMIPDITNTLFPLIVRGAEQVLEEAGYASIIVNTDDIGERESRLIDVLLERNVDGIIDAAASRDDLRVNIVENHGIPIVTVNRQVERSAIPSVVNDDAEGIRLAFQHLYEAGHRKIAHIAGPQNVSTSIARLATFHSEAKAHGLDLPVSATVMSNHFDEDEGRRCTAQLLEQRWKCTAILCANDRLALGAIDQVRRHGLSCPEDISVTGFNDVPFLDLIPPGLTTIHVQQHAIGRLAAELLLKMIKDKTATIPRTTILPVTLVKRGSVAPPRKLAIALTR